MESARFIHSLHALSHQAWLQITSGFALETELENTTLPPDFLVYHLPPSNGFEEHEESISFSDATIMDFMV
jgi:hypothetical protein